MVHQRNTLAFALPIVLLLVFCVFLRNYLEWKDGDVAPSPFRGVLPMDLL